MESKMNQAAFEKAVRETLLPKLTGKRVEDCVVLTNTYLNPFIETGILEGFDTSWDEEANFSIDAYYPDGICTIFTIGAAK